MSSLSVSDTNTPSSIAGVGIAVVLIVLFAMVASRIVFGSSGFVAFFIGAGLAWIAGFGAVVIPGRLLPTASTHLIAWGLCALLVFHYLWNFSQIQLFSKTSLAYALAIVGARYGGECVLRSRKLRS